MCSSLIFVVNDLAWLQDARLDTDALPARDMSHLSAVAHGVMIRQPSVPYHSVPPRPAAVCCKRSGRSRLQRWIKHSMSHQAISGQLAMLSSDEPTISLFPSSSEESLGDSDCESSGGAAEVLMADTNRGGGLVFIVENSPGCDGGERRHIDDNHYVPQSLTKQQREEIQRRSE